MQIDTEHLHYWMCAIRESQDPKRTLDAFWKGQLSSKEWLIENIKPFIKESVSVDIYGGWVGALASMLFQSDIPINHIRSIDIDPVCRPIATMMNKGEEIQGRFSAITADMCNVVSETEVVINTSCEHVSQQQYEIWLNNISKDSLVVLQSNNYLIDEHVRIARSLQEFEEQSKINILMSSQLELPLYTRWMIIGKVDV